MSKVTSELKFLLKHSSIYGLGNLLSKLVGFILLPLYTRHLTPKDYGILELIDISTTMIGLVIAVGVSMAFSQFYFDYKSIKNRYCVVSTVYIIVTMSVTFFITIISFFTDNISDLIFGNNDYSYLILIGLLALAFGTVADLGLIYLRIRQKSLIFIIISLGMLIVGVSLNIYFIVFAKLGVLGFLYASLFTKVLLAIPITIIILSRTGLSFNFNLARKLIIYSAPLIPSQLANTLVSYSDRYFINFHLSLSAAGIFGIAQKLGTVLHMFITMPFISTFMPRRFEIAEEQDSKAIFADAFKYYMLIMTSFSLSLSVFSKEMIAILTQPAFYAAADLIPLITVSIILLGSRYHFEFGIFYKKKTVLIMYRNIMSLILHLALNFTLIPMIGLWGAIISYILATLFSCIYSYIYAQKEYRIQYDFINLLKLSMISLLIFYMADLIKFESLILSILFNCIALIFFPILLLIFKVITFKEINIATIFIWSKFTFFKEKFT